MTLTVGGGQRTQLNMMGRLAAVLGKRLGVKVTGAFSRGNDFELESCDSNLLMMGLLDQCPDPLDAQQLNIDGPRDNEYNRILLSGYGEYRFGRSTSLHISGGVSRLNGTVLSGIGTLGLRISSLHGGRSALTVAHSLCRHTQTRITPGIPNVYNGDSVTEYSRQTNAQGQ